MKETYFVLALTVATTKKTCFTLASREATPRMFNLKNIYNTGRKALHLGVELLLRQKQFHQWFVILYTV